MAAFETWTDAQAVTTEEAEQVVTMARHARFLPEGVGAEMVGVLACYARSVEHLEWRAMRRHAESDVSADWLQRLNDTVSAHHEEGAAVEQFVELEAALTAERHRRLSDAEPSVPDSMYLFMVVTVALTVFSLAYFTRMSIAEPGHAALLVVAALILGGSLAIVRDLDTPYSGTSRIDPTSIAHAQQELEHERAQYSGRAAAPCDAQGKPS